MSDARQAAMSGERRAMVADLARRKVSDPRVLDAMARIPRERFVPDELKAAAYDDGPLPIGGGQTISQPLVVALMAQAAAIEPEDVALEVGAGSGYAAAVLGLLAKRVVGVERDPKLAAEAADRIAALGYDNAEIVCGDGTLGWPDAAPFDAIVVSAAPNSVPPALKAQLAIGGRLVAPVGGQWTTQELVRITRLGEADFREDNLCRVRFVPLVSGRG